VVSVREKVVIKKVRCGWTHLERLAVGVTTLAERHNARAGINPCHLLNDYLTVKDEYMTTITVTCKVNVPADANYTDTLEWVKFELGQQASLKNKNPLSEYDLSAYNVRISED